MAKALVKFKGEHLLILYSHLPCYKHSLLQIHLIPLLPDSTNYLWAPPRDKK